MQSQHRRALSSVKQKTSHKNLPPSDSCWTRQNVTHSQCAAYSFWTWDRMKKMETKQCPKDWKAVVRDCASKRRTAEKRGGDFLCGRYMVTNISFFCANDVSALRYGFITVQIKSETDCTVLSFTEERWLAKCVQVYKTLKQFPWSVLLFPPF